MENFTFCALTKKGKCNQCVKLFCITKRGMLKESIAVCDNFQYSEISIKQTPLVQKKVSALWRSFLRQFDRKAKQSVPRHTFRLIEVSALQCVHFIEILLHKLKQLLYIKRGLSFLTKWGRCYKVELLLQSRAAHRSNERNEGGQQILATGSLFTSNLPSDRQFASRNSS